MQWERISGTQRIEKIRETEIPLGRLLKRSVREFRRTGRDGQKDFAAYRWLQFVMQVLEGTYLCYGDPLHAEVSYGNLCNS